MGITINRPIEYTKGEVKTRDLHVSVNRKLFLGEGAYGKVFVAKHDPTKAVKKSWHPMTREYNIGAQLHHENFVKIHALFIKHFPNFQNRYKLVMERIIGKPLKNIPSNSLPFTITLPLMQQAVDSCLYLFDRNIAWDDIHGGNLYIEESPPKLIIADFGFWEKINDPSHLTTALMRGLRMLLFFLLETSSDLSPQERKQLIRILHTEIDDLKALAEEITQWISLCKDRRPESHAKEPRPLS